MLLYPYSENSLLDSLIYDSILKETCQNQNLRCVHVDTLEENHQIPTTDIIQDSKKDTVTAITATVPNTHGLDSAIQRERSQSNFFWHPVSGYISVTNNKEKLIDISISTIEAFVMVSIVVTAYKSVITKRTHT